MIEIPSLPKHYMPRPRLDELWRQAAGRRLVLVTAGAGFGKTSFLAEQARASASSVIWRSLDEMDADPTTFLARISRSVQAVDPAAARGEGDGGAASESALFAGLLREMKDHGRGTVFFLDDVQNVAQSAEVLRLIERLVHVLPDNCSIVLSSREPIGIQTARLHSVGAVARIAACDLQFTEEEISQFLLRRFPGIAADAGLARRILAETEGWAAGIEILFQVSGGSAWAIGEALDRSAAAGSGWFAYFAEEVLGRLDPSMQDFLLRSSVLPSMEAGMCDRVLGLSDSGRRLESLCARNLFTFPLDGERPAYRYHHLFREFLRDRLERVLDREDLRRLRLRSAEALSGAGAWAEAAVGYVEGGDPGATLAVIEGLGEKLLAAGNYRVLRRALESIPESMLDKHPAALTLLGRLQEIHGEWEQARLIYRKLLLLLREGTERAGILSLLAQTHIRRGEYAQGERACLDALEQPGRKSARLRGRIHCLLGVSAGERGRLDEAEKRFREAIRTFRRLEDAREEGRALGLMAANVYYYRGDYRRAKDAGRQALVIFQRLRDAHGVCHTMMGIGQHAAAAAEEREARDLAERALRIAESLEYRMAEGYCHFTLGTCAILSRNPEGAQRQFDRARHLGEQLGEMSLLTWPLLGRAEAHLLGGNRRGARILAEEVLTLTRRGRSPYVEARCYLILGRAEPPSQARAAGRWWRKAEGIHRRIGARRGLHEVLLLLLAGGEIPARREPAALRELLTGIATFDHRFLLTEMEPERAAAILPRAILLDVETEFAASILVALGERALPHIESALPGAAPPARARFVEIVAQIGGCRAQRILEREGRADSDAGRAARSAARDLKAAGGTPLKVRALGPWIVAVGGESLTADRFRSSRAARLLQYLFLQRRRWVPSEAILEALWPDAEPEKAMNSLRQSVHILRRVLEPGAVETRSSTYVRFRNDAYRLDLGEGGDSDVEAFERLIREGERWIDGGQRRKAEKALQEAIDLYRGDLFEESPYEDFLTAAREDLRDRYVRALERLIELHASGEHWEPVIALCRRGMLRDPYSEAFAWQLIHAMLRLGSRHEALEAYHRYEALLAQDLNLVPSRRMQALAEQATGLVPRTGRAR